MVKSVRLTVATDDKLLRFAWQHQAKSVQDNVPEDMIDKTTNVSISV